jgi:hypothetical protein
MEMILHPAMMNRDNTTAVLWTRVGFLFFSFGTCLTRGTEDLESQVKEDSWIVSFTPDFR